MSSPTNLLNLKCFRVVLRDGTTESLTLREVLAQAPDISHLDGEVGPQYAALLRFLIALVLVSVSDPDRDAIQAMGDWTNWWGSWASLDSRVQDYLTEHENEFELAGPQPFMQVATLQPATTLPSGLQRLVPDIGQWFNTRVGDSATTISAEEAFRWLLYVQSWDVAGIKTGAAGDPAVKGGRAYPTGYPAWAGNLGMVILEADDLAHTILVNLPLAKYPDEQRGGWQLDRPTHRRDTQRPRGPAELFAWPNRAIRLNFREDGRVDGVQVSYGDTLTPQNMNHLEPMAAWRHSEPQTKKAKFDVQMPVTHSATRRVWQGLGALVATIEQQPATLRWLGELQTRGHLDSDTRIRLRTIGVEYGPQNSTVNSIIDDSLDAHVAALTSGHLATLASDCAAHAAKSVGALTHLNALLAQAAGRSEEAARERAAQAGYAALDLVFRSWLLTLRADSDTAEATRDWQARLRSTLLQQGQTLCTLAGEQAIVGRVTTASKDSQPQLVTTGSAWRWFWWRVGQLTPAASTSTAHPTAPPQEESSHA